MSSQTGVTSFLQLKKDRRASRFTLLFLEYNEFLLQDLAVYKYEAPTVERSWYVYNIYIYTYFNILRKKCCVIYMHIQLSIFVILYLTSYYILKK